MWANILGETFCEVVALKRAGLEKKDLFSLAVFEVLGQFLLEGFHWKNIGISCIRSGKVKATERSHFRHMVVIFPYSRICLIPLYLSC